MKSECRSGLGDISIIVIEDTLDVLPFESVKGAGSEFRICLGFGRIAR